MSDFRLISVLGQPVLQVVLSGVALSAGANSLVTGTAVFSNSNGVTFGMDTNGVVTASVAGGGGGGSPFTAGVSNLGNTAGNTGTVSNRLVLAGGNNITLSQSTDANGATVTLSGVNTVAQSVQTQNMVSVQGSTGAISFANSNGITFGGNNSTITASYTVPSTAGLISALRVSAGTTSGDQTGLTFSNSNGLSFGLNAGTVTGSYTVPSTAGLISGVNLSAGTTSQNLTAFVFSNSNGISFGLNGSTVTASYTTPLQSNQSLGMYAVGNTTGQSSSTTFDARTFSIQGAGIASVGYSNGSLVVSVPSGGGAGDGGNVIAAGTQTATSLGTVKFADSNGISFGLSASTQLTASYTVPSTAGLISAVNVSAGTTSGNQTGVTFSNANGVTFGFNNGTITASITPAGGAQTGISGLSAGTTQATSGTVSFADGNGVTFGINGNTLTASVKTDYLTSQSNQALSGSNGSFAFQTATFGALNGLSFYTSNGSMVGSYTVPSTAGLLSNINVSAGTTSGNLSAFTLSNSNGISFGLNAGTITASYTVPTQTNQTGGVYAVGNTTGQSSSSTYDARSLSVQGTGIASVGWSNGSLLVSVDPGAAVLNAGMSTGGNTAGDTGLVTNRLVLAGGNNVTLSGSTAALNRMTITISAAAQTVQTQSNVQGIIVSNTTYRTGDVSFSNANGISFGSSAGQAITASYTVPSTAGLLSAVNLSAGTTSQNLSQFVFSNSNGVSFGLNGSTITASVAAGGGGGAAISAGANSQSTGTVNFANSNGVTFGLSNNGSMTASVAAQSNQSLGIYFSSNTTGASSSSTYDARSLTMQFLGGVSGGWSNGSVQISGPSLTSLSVTGALSASSNGNTISLGVGTVTVSATSNTTQGSSGTVNLNGLIFAGAGAASVGISNGSVVVSAPNAGAGNVTFSAGTTSGGFASLVFSNSNGVSFGLNGSTITASVNAGGGGGIGGGVSTFGNTAGSTGTVTTGNIVFVGSGPISLSQSTGAAGSAATISILGPATSSLVGASGLSVSTNGSTISIYAPLKSDYENAPYLFNSQSQTVGQSTSVVFPFDVEWPHTFTYGRLAHSVSLASTSFASTAATQYSYNLAETHNLVLYSLGTGANSQSLQSYASKSVGVTMSINLSRNTTNNISVTHGLTYPVSNGTSSISFSYAATNSSDQFSTTHMTALSGIKLWDTQFGTTLSAGEWFLAYGVSTNQTTQGTAALSAARLVHSHLGLSQPNVTVGQFGSANNASVQLFSGMGSYSNAGGGTTASLGLSNISSSASHVVPWLNLNMV